ncbi:MAG TPA: MFS transporter [Streptosporangiaceae bacterium]|nr:MFS transporter [Streptosporangiaceae bacterium]
MDEITATKIPAALAEPVTAVKRGWVTLLFLANTGMWLAIYAPIQVLLPEQVESLHHADKAALFSVVMAAGAIASLIANPIVGAHSDRTTHARGRRHPWTLAGAVTGAAGLAILAGAPDIPVMVLGWCVAQIGLGGMLATLTSALPDRVPANQRGTIGGLIGISQMLGTVLGALIVILIVTGISAGYLTCGLLVVAGAAVFVLKTPDETLPAEYKPATPIPEALKQLWISPKRYPDFGWAWLTHFLVNLGNDLGTLYLLYFLTDQVHPRNAQDNLLILMALYAIALAVAGVVCGNASDKSGRRRPYIIGAAGACGLAALLLVISPTWSLALVAAPLLGFGFGTYWAAAPAVLTAVLPAATDRAKDLGVLNIGYSLPLVVAPVIAGGVVGLGHSYPALFALAGLASVAAGGTITKVRSIS